MADFSRRSFVQTIGAAAAAAALPIGTQAAGSGAARRLILFSVGGGWDISYALDPKPGVATVDAPEGEIQEFSNLPIFASESRPNVTSFFEAWAPLTAVVNGVDVRSISHITCSQKIFTGYPSTRGPDAAAIVGHELGRELPLPYLVLGDVAFSGSLGVSTGRVGSLTQIKALLPPGDFFPTTPEFAHGGYDATPEDEAIIRQFIDRRIERERAMRGAEGHNRKRVEDFAESLAKSDAVRAQAGGFGDFTDTLSMEGQVDFAVRALREDLALTASIDSRLDWDTHTYNEPQGIQHDMLFSAINYLAEQLEASPGQSGSTLLDETIVVVMSEMSRTPLLNASGGKDHWPVTSMMMFGGPIAGGRVFGATNDLVEARHVDYATGEVSSDGRRIEPVNILAGLVDAVGVDPATHYPNAEAFCAPFA